MKTCCSSELLCSTVARLTCIRCFGIATKSSFGKGPLKAAVRLIKIKYLCIRYSKRGDLNITTGFNEFPGERGSVTCWREARSDK